MKAWIGKEFPIDSIAACGWAETIVRRRKSIASVFLTFVSALVLAQSEPACADDASADAARIQLAAAEVRSAWPSEQGATNGAFAKLAEYAEMQGSRKPGEARPTTAGHQVTGHSADFVVAHPKNMRLAEAERPEEKLAAASGTHAGIHDDAISALIDFAKKIATDGPTSRSAETGQAKAGSHDDPVSALVDYARQIGSGEPKLRLAEAAKAKAKAKAVGQAPKPVKVVSGEATYIGAQVCQTCHLVQAAAFNQTLMGKIFRNPRNAREKEGCESCHGPGSLHLRAVGCASCHGEGGITTKPGIPSLAGENPEYLVPAMKAYVSGQRHHALMKAVLSGVGEAELNNIAAYYAAQPPARAQTPLVGDPSAGRAATGLCAGCHGEQGVGTAPAFPNLAGQDAQYLADALKEYKQGSRSKVIACAACHGAGGVSKRPGTPSLAGVDPAYLIAEMKAYAGGERDHDLMKMLASGLGEAELKNIAVFYARQTPARAQTPLVGDPAAGKAAAAACAGCHGQEGVSSNPIWPSLAGQDSRYLANELRAYKAGSRSNAMMKALAATLDDRAIDNVASYYATLQPAKPTLTDAMQGAPVTGEPVVVRNGLVANLDERRINNVASYYASLVPAQPTAKRAPARSVPARVGTASPIDGRSLEILSFRLNDPTHTVDEFNGVCLGCHEKGDRTLWRGSAHETRGVACVSCHTVMRNVTPKHQLAKLTEMDTCFQCHKNKRAEIWRSSHMPVREGKMTCSSCHNPHGTYGEALMKTATINDTCYKCHAEKRGPFLWEHAPVRENCLNCHDPHGSMQDAMLKVSRPRLCQQCHTSGDHPGNPLNPRATHAIAGACLNCHVKVHGSNSPAGSQLFR